jgi:S1-C subfamily serine protease
MIYSPSGGSVGIGFAVPVETAKRVIPDLIKFGEVLRGWIDITPVQLFPQLVRYADLPVSRGILISEMVAGGEADRAGLKAGSPRRAVRAGRNVIYLGGDIIVEVDGTEINTLGDLYGALEDNKPGDTVEVKVIRGRQERELSVVLVQRG